MKNRIYKSTKSIINIIASDPNRSSYWRAIYDPENLTMIYKQCVDTSPARGKMANGMIDMGASDSMMTVAEITSIVEEETGRRG